MPGAAEKTRHVDVAPEVPNDTEAEHVVLGHLIIAGDPGGEVFDTLVTEDFFDTRHQVIYGALRGMWERGLKDLPILSGELHASGRLEGVGGNAYLSALIDGMPYRMNAAPYVARIRSKRVLRDLAHTFEAGRLAVFDANQSGSPESELIDNMIEVLASLGKLASSDDRGKTYQDAAISLLNMLQEEKGIRVYTGVKTVDEVTGGFRPGELIVLTAETGAGKSFFALQIRACACLAGWHTLYASGEMKAEHLMGRVLSSDAGVSYYKIRRPELLDKSEVQALLQAASHTCKVCRTLDGELSLARIRMAARHMAANKQLGCVIVDYDELVEVKGKDEWDQQRILVRALKSLGMQLGVPVVMVSQLRKPLDPQDRKRPTLARLYGSGAKSKHASLVIHIDRPFVRELKGDETEAKVFILKSRDGRMGVVDCFFNLKTFKFEERASEPN